MFGSKVSRIFVMPQPGETVAAKSPKRVQLMFIQAFAVTLLVWLVFYTLADTNTPSLHHENSWSFTGFLSDTLFSGTKEPGPPRKRMLVLLWNNFYSKTKDSLVATLDSSCPASDCDVTSNRSLLVNSSAVIMHWRSLDHNDLPPCDPSSSDSCPLWVLFNRESPMHTTKDSLQAIEGRVHWTATYRRDSDLFSPYGKVIPRITPDYIETALDPNKRLVCWLVSNCNTPSNRESFVSELEDYIDVDIYGRCGNQQCPHKAREDCYKWLSERCLFYLSLENSLCRDYTTEKLYLALSTDMIPIVMGNNSNYRHLPPHSYINALDFSETKALADHLLKVSKDEKLYQSYFVWKVHYEVKDYSYNKWYCDLCAMLHSTDTRKVKPRNQLVSWWFNQSSCWSWQKL